MKVSALIGRARAQISDVPWRAMSIRSLLVFESLLTVPLFIASWLVCATGFSVVAGYRMAKADSAQKRKILEKTLGGGAES